MAELHTFTSSRTASRARARLQIAVFAPHLPLAAAVLPYLEAIDRARRYTNGGPLLGELEAGLAEHFRLPPGGVVCVANGTLALTLALAAREPARDSLCMMPSWTFVATAHAVVAAGLTPWLVDVDAQTWALTPALARRYLAAAPGEVGAILPVAPFGAPVDAAAWDAFALETGIPVAVDAAAGFDSARPGEAPVMVSLHATKALGVGEGGLVASRDVALIEEVRRRASFGFDSDRTARVAAINAKMSEYTAAVGLAGLAAWPRTLAAFAARRAAYARALPNIEGIRRAPRTAGWISSTLMVRSEAVPADEIERVLTAHGIATRRWWGQGCHDHPAFADCPRGPLPVTAALAASTIGLPLHLGLDGEDIARVASALGEAVTRGADARQATA